MHHTIFLIFQPNPSIEGEVISNSEFSYSGQGADVDYKIGKLVPPPLISEYEDRESGTLIRHCFAKDVLWALAGGLPKDNYDKISCRL